MYSRFFDKLIACLKRASLPRTLPFLHSYCLGIDIVGYSKNSTDTQLLMVTTIQGLIRESAAIYTVNRQDLIFLPTGDGMIIGLTGQNASPLIILQLAKDLQIKLGRCKTLPVSHLIPVRMGIHSGTGASYVDINDNLNISGTVANTTQRITSIGEDWHVIASKNAFDDIATLDEEVRHHFHYLGFAETKHKDSIEVYNVFSTDPDAFGNQTTPPWHPRYPKNRINGQTTH